MTDFTHQPGFQHVLGLSIAIALLTLSYRFFKEFNLPYRNLRGKFHTPRFE